MQTSTISAPAESPARRPIANAHIGTVLVLLTLAALWLVLWRDLSSEWSLNEQYSYGWFVPFFAGFLFWLRWEEREKCGSRIADCGTQATRQSATRISQFAIPLLLLFLLPIRLFEVGNPDWRPLGWAHALVVVTLTLTLTYRAGGTAWLKHFAFPILFTLIAVPWISGIEQPLIEGLMRGVAAVAAETLNVFGIPAQLEGNLIRVSNGVVGVNEACSGVRSLQTSVMIGLLFGELKRLSVARRLGLVAGAIGIALIANCLRALLLVWIAASQSLDAVHHWHDIAGYSIVAAVFLGTMAIAAVLGKKNATTQSETPMRREHALHSAIRIPQSAILLALGWLVAVEIAVEAWYRARERNLIPVSAWSVEWPKETPGFRTIDIDESVRRTLRFDTGGEATWPLAFGKNRTQTTGMPPAAPHCFAFFFRWNAGGSSVVRARAHRPDICLPSAGWEPMNDRGPGDFAAGDLRVPFRRVAFRKGAGNVIAHTYFCLQEDLRRPTEDRPDLQLAAGTQPDWSITGRARVVRNGVRNLGQQVLEVVIVSSGPMSDEEADREFAALLPQLIRERSS
ncbi:MAG: archaeosortase/exosortase family protein [Chthoniobacterales bacterium]